MNHYLAVFTPYIIAIIIAFTTATGLELLNISPSMVGALGAGAGTTAAIIYKKTFQPRTDLQTTNSQ